MKRLILLAIVVTAAFLTFRSTATLKEELPKEVYGAVIGIKAGMIAGANQFNQSITKKKVGVTRGLASE